MRRRGWVAGVVSTLAHLLTAGLLFVVWGRAPPRDRGVVSAPIEVEIAQQARTTPRSRPLAPVGAPAVVARRPAPGGRGDDSTLARQKSDGDGDGDGDREHEREPGGEDRDESRPPPAPQRHPGPDSSDLPEVDRPPAPGLAPELSFWGLPPAVQERVVGPSPEGGVRSPPPSVDELRILVERREDAVANVRAGRVDPVLYDYLRGARARFEDEARRLAGTIALDAGTSVGGWVRGYLQTVEDVHRLSAVDEAPDLRDEAARRRPDLAAASDESLRQAENGAEERRAEVCLDVAPGRAPAVALRRGSGNAALDRVALDAFTRSAALRPVPSDARAGRACYEVRISAFRAPPGPFVTCGLGRAGVTCIWPFKRITSVTGRLLSAEYPPARNAPAVRSLLRAPR